MKNPVIIFGANYLGRAAKEIFETNNIVVYGFLDDDKQLHEKEVDEAVVLGSTDDERFLKLIGKKCEAFVAIDDNKLRRSIVKMLHEIRHVQPANAVHSHASIAAKAEIGYGNFIDHSVYLAPGAKIGSHSILHAKVFVGVATEIGDFVQVGAGSTINPAVKIEDEAFLGSGVTVVSGITIGKGARVGAGSVVVAPIKAGETVFGNPAQVIK
jgi:sugar O-acyltransferase (sialic acid O-acetyltransferase NeuD family)